MRSREECGALQQEMAILKKQVEATWASERMANALLRERINDVAGEVVRVAHALEGLGSPIDTMLAGKLGRARRRGRRNSAHRTILPTAMTPRACSPTASAPCRSARRGWHRPGDHRQG